MSLVDTIDPFLMQLIIVPFTTIGLGVLLAVFTKKIFIGPLATLLLNLLYEVWYSLYYYPESELLLTPYNIIFPLISLVLSAMFVGGKRAKERSTSE
ncbi:hypothetical protein [Oceanobacillus kapialis]|uniref:hypothetical protein n=1 Tax=Oceanobacillus kapialis TaxID=481353 RepID=UPI00384D2D71